MRNDHEKDINFLTLYFGAFFHPSDSFLELRSHPRKIRLALQFISVPVVGYIFVYIFLNAGGGAPSTFTPWLNIGKADYYYYNQFLTAPSFLMAWIFAAGFVQLICHAFSSKGQFEDILANFGLAIGVAMWATLLHDLVIGVLGNVNVISLPQHEIDMNSPTPWRTLIWTLMIGYTLWFEWLFIKAVRVSHGLSMSQAIFAGTIGFVSFQMMFFIFNR